MVGVNAECQSRCGIPNTMPRNLMQLRGVVFPCCWLMQTVSTGQCRKTCAGKSIYCRIFRCKARLKALVNRRIDGNAPREQQIVVQTPCSIMYHIERVAIITRIELNFQGQKRLARRVGPAVRKRKETSSKTVAIKIASIYECSKWKAQSRNGRSLAGRSQRATE